MPASVQVSAFKKMRVLQLLLGKQPMEKPSARQNPLQL